MKRFSILSIAILSIVAFAFSDAAMAAGPVFSKASLNGGYGGQFSGYWWFRSIGKQDINAVEVFQFDGNGNFTGTVTLGLANALVQPTAKLSCTNSISGTYTVNSDGTGTMTGGNQTDPTLFCQNTYIFDLALSNNGRTFNQSLRFVVPNDGGTIMSAISTGTVSKQIPY